MFSVEWVEVIEKRVQVIVQRVVISSVIEACLILKMNSVWRLVGDFS